MPQEFHFDIHPSVVFQLGADLITDVVQALVELVKNSYDADADYANVKIDSLHANEAEHSVYRGATGVIVIEDNGTGMDLETVRRGWLMLSDSPKREMKERGEVTGKGRTPLGDKGLGRLGAQRLGDHVEIITRKQDMAKALHVAFSWSDFRAQGALSTVPVRITEIAASFPHGTRLTLSGLYDTGTWEEPRSLDSLQADLSRMISPYKRPDRFKIVVTVNGKRLELERLVPNIRRAATAHYQLKFDGQTLQTVGRAKLSLFNTRQDNAAYTDLLAADQGTGFLEFLREQPSARDLALRVADSEQWFVEYRNELDIAALDKVELVPSEDGTKQIPANPGPFFGEVDSFDLGSDDAVTQDVFSATSAFRRAVRNLQGIRVYRDGFAVRVDDDWLGLGKAWTTGKSWYGLKPANTMGYVAISAKANEVLSETTNREGFKKTPHYDNFLGLLQHFVRTANNAQGILRRAWVDYRKQHAKAAAGFEPEATADRIAWYVGETLKRAGGYTESFVGIRRSLEDAASDTDKLIANIAGTLPESDRSLRQLTEVRERVTGCVADVANMLGVIDEYSAELAKLKVDSQVLVSEIESLQERLADMYETVSLGLTAEALSHELQNIAAGLAARAHDVAAHLRRQGEPDRRLLAFVEHVKSTVAAMRKQLSHLAPSLRYVREQREDIGLRAFLLDLSDYYAARFQHKSIGMEVATVCVDDFYAMGADGVVEACTADPAAKQRALQAMGIVEETPEEVWQQEVRDGWTGLDSAARTRVISELRRGGEAGAVDGVAASALTELLTGIPFHQLSMGEWRSRKEEFAGSDADGGLLLLFDENFEREGLGERDGVIEVVKLLADKQRTTPVYCGLLTHKYEPDGEVPQWEATIEAEGLDGNQLMVISKRRLKGDPMGFARMLKLLALAPQCNQLLNRVAGIIETGVKSALAECRKQVNVYDFEHLVFEASRREGVWEPDTLVRILRLFLTEHVRTEALVNAEVCDLASKIRDVSLIGTVSGGATRHESWRIQRREMYLEGVALNRLHLPLDLGDIFCRKGTNGGRDRLYILVGQPCDLMVRTDGKRRYRVYEANLLEVQDAQDQTGKREVEGAVLVEILAKPGTGTHELRYWDDADGHSWCVNLRAVHTVKLWVLDLCVFREDGKGAMGLDDALPDGLIPAWQERFSLVQKEVRKALDADERHAKANMPANDSALRPAAITSSNDAKFYGTADREAKSVSFGIERIARYQQPFTGGLLRDYARHIAREAYEVDIGRVDDGAAGE